MGTVIKWLAFRRRSIVSSVHVLLVLVVSPMAWADDGWLHEFDEASAAAKEQGKDLLIDFSGTDWCGPCKRLWTQSLSQPEFVELARQRFVLLDIDNLVREAMPEGRKQRYDALAKRYGVEAFPTVVLATAEGLPYAVTGLIEDQNTPPEYWRHLEPLYERGQKFKAALKAGGQERLASAETIVAALAELRPEFVVKFYPDKLKQLRELTPRDETGYLAFIDFKLELVDLELKLHDAFLTSYDKWSDGEPTAPRWTEAFSPRDADAIIEKHRPHGASLREALVVRAFLEIDAGQWAKAVATLDAIADTHAPLAPFERANFVQFTVPSVETLREHVRLARQSNDPLAQLRVIYGILEGNIQSLTPTSCCNHGFWLQMHQLRAGAAYGQLLLDSTAHLKGAARATAIAKGLEGIELFANGPIGRMVYELMPELVGKEAAIKLLPPRYADWLRD